MKRKNKLTNKPFKQGDVREDGFIFWGYSPKIKKDGFFEENWCNPLTFEDQKRKARERTKKYQKYMYLTSPAYREACSESAKRSLDKKMSTKEGHIAEIFRKRRLAASKHGILFDITLDHLIEIAPDTCPVFKEPLLWAIRSKKAQSFSPSLDKIDPAKGYTKGNVQWVSFLANAMKQNANKDQLIKFSEWILKTQKDSNENQ